MDDQPHIHFIQGNTPQECEDKVNAWIDALPYLCSVGYINVIPMMMGASLVFLACVTYMKQPSYMGSDKPYQGGKG
jgi:hypothetical protein